MADSAPESDNENKTSESRSNSNSFLTPPRNGRFVRLLALTRVTILFGAFASLLASVVLLAQSAITVAQIGWESIVHPKTGSHAAAELAVEFLGVIDSVLLGTVLYIVALGLYELFFEPELPTPKWLQFRELSQLKESLIEVIVVLLGVLFVSHAVTWEPGEEILPFGLATGGVILALTLVLFVGHIRRNNHSE